MPRLNDLNVDLEKQKLPTGNYSFSATRIADLGSSEYTLATIIVDWSGSTVSFRAEMEKCLKAVINSCKYSPRAECLMVRLLIFARDIKEIHGFKLLANCNEADYDGILQKDHGLGSTTALNDATVNGAEAATVYGMSLIKQDFSANGITVVITDGMNNEGVFTANTVKQKFAESVSKEALESMLPILVGVNINEPAVSAALKAFAADGGFAQYEEIAKADAKTLAKLANFVSASISSQSSALNSGGPSQPLQF